MLVVVVCALPRFPPVAVVKQRHSRDIDIRGRLCKIATNTSAG